MIPFDTAELIFIRHAPAATQGRVCGRRDVPLRSSNDATGSWAETLTGISRVVCSPALRCRQTATALFPEQVPDIDARLWEQDFGTEDGVAYADLPDLGALSRQDLAMRCPPGGESFAMMVARAAPALEELASQARASGPVAIVAHAGTVRAGLALALESVPDALIFEVVPLSITRLRCLDGGWSIIAVNLTKGPLRQAD